MNTAEPTSYDALDRSIDNARTFRPEDLLPSDCLILLLASSAVGLSVEQCLITDCEACQKARLAWWFLSNALTCRDRRDLHRALRLANIPLPGSPSEEVA